MKLSSSVGLALLGAATAAPAVDKDALPHSLDKRNVCDGVDASPILYTEYHADSCPPTNIMNADGTCPGQDYVHNHCASFCEVRTTFWYGKESPIQNSYCHGPFTCTITDTTTTTITKSGQLNFNWELGIKMGVTGGYQYADANANARAFQVKLDQGQCGYFTVVPVFRTTCGSVTEGYLDGREDTWTCAQQTTTGNVCVDQQKLNSDGSVDSETIFVHTDCGTRAPLDPSQQDPIWNHDGVPLDRQSYDVMAENWQSVGEASQGLSYSQAQCGANPYTMPVADVWTASQNLDAIGDQDCCTNDDGSCINTQVVNGIAVDLCGQNDGVKLCANCARVANYVAGLTSCVDENNNVGAIQDIVETPGMTVQI